MSPSQRGAAGSSVMPLQFSSAGNAPIAVGTSIAFGFTSGLQSLQSPCLGVTPSLSASRFSSPDGMQGAPPLPLPPPTLPPPMLKPPLPTASLLEAPVAALVVLVVVVLVVSLRFGAGEHAQTATAAA